MIYKSEEPGMVLSERTSRIEPRCRKNTLPRQKPVKEMWSARDFDIQIEKSLDFGLPPICAELHRETDQVRSPSCRTDFREKPLT
jgi:hypothetical protein